MELQTIITINWAEGRSNAVKKEIVDKLAEGLPEIAGISKEKLFIYFYDLPSYNSGVEGNYMGKV